MSTEASCRKTDNGCVRSRVRLGSAVQEGGSTRGVTPSRLATLTIYAVGDFLHAGEFHFEV